MLRRLLLALGSMGAATAIGAEGADGGGSPAAAQSAFYATDFGTTLSVAAMTALGRALFFDASLSASGKMACATCHSPRRAFGPPGDRAVQRGGGDGRQPGVRAVPSLEYTQNIAPFTEHYVDDEGDDSVDQGPAGGRTWDGRASSAHDQALLPLFSPFEMGNPSVKAVVAKVEHGGYAAQFRDAFGEGIFHDAALAFKAVLTALETYQQNPADFYPYTSKYDAWLKGEASLTDTEARGLAVFEDPAKGNCARCHPSSLRQGALPQFTDFGYAALGVPRNPAIPANARRQYFDLGLCGPWRTDLADHPEYCGLFRTPTLRNVAIRGVFFHNGAVHRLEDAVRFYAQRDTRPRKWYTRSGSAVRMFDDLPERYWNNLERQPPFGRRAGDAPALSAGDIRDIVAFLRTLSDGYDAGGASLH